MEPWGKLDRCHRDRTTAPRLSLVAHCIDVAAVARALMELPTWRRRMERLAGRALSQLDLDRLTVLAFLHDVGKAGAGFYGKALSEDVVQAWRAKSGADRTQQGHTRVVAPLLDFRVSGDGPTIVAMYANRTGAAPRERGWTHGLSFRFGTIEGGPA